MASAILAQLLPEAASGAGALYERLGEKQKTGIAAGLSALGFGANSIITLPVTIIGTIINFIVLAVIFIASLFSKYREETRLGISNEGNEFRRALTKGLGLALAASVILFIANLITGGLATLVMFGVYLVAGIGYLLLSLINLPFLNDVSRTEKQLSNGTTIVDEGHISGYRKWSLVFWPVFLISILISIAIVLAFGVAGAQITKMIANLVAPMASKMGVTGNIIGSLPDKVVLV